ncbi:MAG: DUF6470 family protein [Sporolactobacillus sp.]
MAQILPHLEMHQVFGQIAVQTQNAEEAIRQPQAELSIQQPKAEMTIERQPAQLQIDQSEAWHNLDLKSARVRIAEAAEAGSNAVLEGIARRAEEGDELLKLGPNKGKNMFAQFAADHVNDAVIGTHYNTGSTPASEAVRLSATPGSLTINWRTHQPEIQPTVHAPEYRYQPGRVNVTMSRYPSLEMHAVGIFVDQKG